MIEIIPAIMPETFEDLETKVGRVSSFVQTVQIDIMDGVFVPEATWPYGEDDEEIFNKIISGTEGLPHGNELNYEIDLMVSNPETVIQKWLEVGASRIIVHIESTNALESIVRDFGRNIIATNPRKSGFLQTKELGLALDIATPNENIYSFVERVNFIQFMGIARIGFQGEPFDERVIAKIKDLRERYSSAIISVDGGVSLESAQRLVEAGVNRLVSGSAIFKSKNIKETIKRLTSLTS